MSVFTLHTVKRSQIVVYDFTGFSYDQLADCFFFMSFINMSVHFIFSITELINQPEMCILSMCM